jgi:hypothetical protein
MYMKIFRILSVVILLVSMLLTNSCSTYEEEPEPAGSEGYVTNEITHVHVKGTDPCPQIVKAKVQVFCIDGEFNGTCGADSVHIKNVSNGLTIKFVNDQMGISLTESSNSRDAFLEFTCGIAESFTHTYQFVLYKDGVEVETEPVKVVVTVVE